MAALRIDPRPRWPLAAAAVLMMAGTSIAAQETSEGAFGIRAIGAAGIHFGAATIQRNVEAFEIGGRLDVGHFPVRRIRVVADVSFLRSLQYEEFIADEDSTYRDVFYDLSGNLMVHVHVTDPSRRLSPYIGAGVGVHALTSSFGSTAIDLRYNTNNLGLRGSAGARLRLGSGRRRALFVEVAGTLVRNVTRSSVHLGLEALFGDLAR